MKRGLQKQAEMEIIEGNRRMVLRHFRDACYFYTKVFDSHTDHNHRYWYYYSCLLNGMDGWLIGCVYQQAGHCLDLLVASGSAGSPISTRWQSDVQLVRQKISEARSEEAEGYYVKGETQLIAGNIELAVKWYTEASDCDPANDHYLRCKRRTELIRLLNAQQLDKDTLVWQATHIRIDTYTPLMHHCMVCMAAAIGS